MAARGAPELRDADRPGARAADALQRKWTLLHFGGPACDADCRDRLVLTRQVRKALNQDSSRVQRVYLAPSAPALAEARAALAAEHPDLLFLADVGAPRARAADFFQPADATVLYLLDPHGNWLMLYRPPVAPRGLLNDLKKLLKFSVIG